MPPQSFSMPSGGIIGPSIREITDALQQAAEVAKFLRCQCLCTSPPSLRYRHRRSRPLQNHHPNRQKRRTGCQRTFECTLLREGAYWKSIGLLVSQKRFGLVIDDIGDSSLVSLYNESAAV